MANELELSRQRQLTEELMAKTAAGKVAWTTTDKFFNATVGPLNLLVFRKQDSPFRWTTFHVGLDGSELMSIQNSKNPSLAKTPRMVSEDYLVCVDLITALVTTFEKQIRDEQFSKAFDAISSL